MNQPQKPNDNKFRFLDRPFMWLFVIAVLMVLWIIPVLPIVGIVIIYRYGKELTSYINQFNDVDEYKKKTEQLLISEREAAERRLNSEKQQLSAERQSMEQRFSEPRFLELREKVEKAEKKLAADTKKIEKLSYLFNAVSDYVKKYQSADPSASEVAQIEKLIAEIEIENLMDPTAEIKLHSADIKDLRKQFKEINAVIDNTLTEYEKRYTTKANLAIYRLMVVALRSELQNILYVMKFGKLEDAELAIVNICNKYIKIAGEGNQSIAPTISRFVLQMQSLFIDAAKVEYEYYLRKERMKEEQRALREQMRQEAEERKRLEEERKKVEKEESKFLAEIEKARSKIDSSDESKSAALLEHIRELEAKLAEVKDKKDVISKLQNGKAGYVYVISNLGSFGDHVFKIGMTRRRDPSERIDELSCASVPFSFDIHTTIFSEDAPALETAIHHRLNNNRVNKVNLRKEFFDISLDELEEIVRELDPSCEFNRTMAAEQYRQSLSINEIFTDFEEENEGDSEE